MYKMDDNQRLLINNTDTFVPKTIKTIGELKNYLENIESDEIRVVLVNSTAVDDDALIECLENQNIQIFKNKFDYSGYSFVFK